jgi:hypothetical protein
MANPKIKTEHAGAKNGDRSYTRAEAKKASKKRRRAVKSKLHPRFWIASPDDLPNDFGRL